MPPEDTAPIAEHPLIQMLVETLPPAGSRLTESQLRRWLAAAEHGLKLIYDVAPDDASPGYRV